MTKKYLKIGTGLLAGGTVIYLLTRSKNLSTDSLKNANQVGIDLGTAYPFFDPRHWTENDQAAEDLISGIPASQIPQLITDYRKLFNRDLTEDLQKYLSGWENVKHKFLKSGLTRGLNKAYLKIKR